MQMMALAEIFTVLMRWIHIASVIVLVGGMGYAWLVAAPLLKSDEAGPGWIEQFTARHRPMVYASIMGVLVSGLYNLLMHPGHTRHYHMWFGLKFLLALHVFAAAIMAVRPASPSPEAEAKRMRRMAGVVISGLVIVAISAYLRRIY